MTSVSENYVFVDKDGGVIEVYDHLGEVEIRRLYEEDYLSKSAWEDAALRIADRLAKKLGCGWGVNFS